MSVPQSQKVKNNMRLSGTLKQSYIIRPLSGYRRLEGDRKWTW